MKLLFSITALLALACCAAAQPLHITPPATARLDSLLKGNKPLLPLKEIAPAPLGSLSLHFNRTAPLPPFAVVLSRDSVYAAWPDNMPVRLLRLADVERMPGSHAYTPAPPSRMPNPLYPAPKPPNKHFY